MSRRSWITLLAVIAQNTLDLKVDCIPRTIRRPGLCRRLTKIWRESEQRASHMNREMPTGT